MRRVTGTTLGPAFLASPETFEGKPINEDATAFSLAVTPTDRARLAVRVEGSPGSPLHGPRIFLTSIGSSSTQAGAKAVAPEIADGGGATPPPAPLGPPAVAAADGGGGLEGEMSLAFTAGGSVRSVGVETQGKLEPPRTLGGIGSVADSPVVATVDPEGGGVTAYEAVDETGSPTVVVRQEFPEGELQTGLLYGPLGGSISQLTGAGTGSGDALLAFSQGESGQVAIVADRISVPPPESAVGGLTYGLVLNGRVVRSNILRLGTTPPAALLGSGEEKVQIVATDRLGGEVVSRPVKLRVDGRPPQLRFQVKRRQGQVVLRLKDTQSGLAPGTVRVNFGDGSTAHGKATLHHRYLQAGRYAIHVRARDRVGNRLAQKIEVTVQ
jgi:hypothetical protein